MGQQQGSKTIQQKKRNLPNAWTHQKHESIRGLLARSLPSTVQSVDVQQRQINS
jgi:hypothetical protein